MEFGSGVVGVEAPVDGGARCIAVGLVSRDLTLQVSFFNVIRPAMCCCPAILSD